MDRERVSLSLKATQEDPWQVFARTHAIGQVTPGKVTKLVPFGAFVRVADGIEGLVHISELSGKHVELAEQVVSVGDEVFVKVIDIDLDRRRISLSLKQANEGIDPNNAEFDSGLAALYGMVTEYDEQGNYKYPEGFDPTSGEWLEGFEAQRDAWEAEYAAAQARWEAHKKQILAAEATEAELEARPSGNSFSSESSSGGTLADDASLAALREKLSSNSGAHALIRMAGPHGGRPSAVNAKAGIRSRPCGCAGVLLCTSRESGCPCLATAAHRAHEQYEAQHHEHEADEHQNRRDEGEHDHEQARSVLGRAQHGCRDARRAQVGDRTHRHLREVHDEGEHDADDDRHPGARREEAAGIVDSDRLGADAAREDDAPGCRAYDGLDPVVDAVDGGNLVGDDLDDEQQPDDHEYPLVGEPGPPARQPDPIEPRREPHHEQRDVGVESRRGGESRARQHLEHAAMLRVVASNAVALRHPRQRLQARAAQRCSVWTTRPEGGASQLEGA
jgi:hypothetical protein